MKTQLVFALVLIAVSAVLSEKTYTDKFDNVDLDQILASDRLLNNYIKCLLETGNCTPDGSELKRTLPDALATDCSKCTPAQNSGSSKVIKFLIKNKPEPWAKLEKKYDPNGVYRGKHPEYFL